MKIPWPGQLAPYHWKFGGSEKIFNRFNNKFKYTDIRSVIISAFTDFSLYGKQLEPKILWLEQFAPNLRKSCKQHSEKNIFIFFILFSVYQQVIRINPTYLTSDRKVCVRGGGGGTGGG